MKKVLFTMTLIIGGLLFADDLAFFHNVTNLWFQGHKSNVFAIAEERISCNSNDIAGLVLKVEYDLEFLKLETLSNSVLSAKEVFGQVASTNFAPWKNVFMQTLDYLLDAQAGSEMYLTLAGDKAKSALPGKHMLFEDIVRAICLDGLVTNYPSLTE